MPVSVRLMLPSEALTRIEEDTADNAVFAALPMISHTDTVTYDVTSVVLVEDVYGRGYDISEEVLVALQSKIPLHKEESQMPEAFAVLGTWRHIFWQYLLGVCTRAHVSMTLSYVHERGDYLYEHARMELHPADGEHEWRCVITCYDGNEDVQRVIHCQRSATGVVSSYET